MIRIFNTPWLFMESHIFAKRISLGMASLAESAGIVLAEAEMRILRPALDMIKLEFFAWEAALATLAGILISDEYGAPKSPVARIGHSLTLRASAVDIVPRTFAKHRVSFACSSSAQRLCVGRIGTGAGAVFAGALEVRVFVKGRTAPGARALFYNAAPAHQ